MEVKILNVFGIKLKVYLTGNIDEKDALEEISTLVDSCLANSEKYSNFHNENSYKLYSFNSFYPLERSRIYKAGKIYEIELRTVNKDLYGYLRNNINNARTEKIKALDLVTFGLKENYIEKLYSITPVIIKTDLGYWKDNLSLKEYENRIATNLIKKYNFLTGQKIEEVFQLFNMISLNNRLPIGCNYKNIRLLGDKLDLVVANNDMAQQLARMAIGVGLGEMNARGYGFVNYRYF